MSAFQKSLQQFVKALQRFEDVMSKPCDDVVRDSAIQRFEFTCELAWKTIKIFLDEKKGISCRSPKDCIRLAFQHGLIENDTYWLDMFDMRNMTSHSYDEKIAEEIYSELKNTLPYFNLLLGRLKK